MDHNQKRKSLYDMDKMLVTFAQSMTHNPHMPDNPWSMTLDQLSDHIANEVKRMNDAQEW